MKFTADCPKCNGEFAIGGEAAAVAGLECPFCHERFTPEKIHRVTAAPIPAAEPENKPDRLKYLEADAGTCFALGIIFVIISVIMAFAAALHDWNLFAVAVSGFTFPFGIMLLFFSQLLHIRAGLERLRK